MSERVAYQGPVLRVCIEEVQLPDGRDVQLEMIRHPGASAVVPFETPSTVLLIRQFRHAAGGVIWEVPAGKLDGETPERCAARELEEEAGRRAGRLVSLGSTLTTPGFTDEVIHLFAAYDLTRVPVRREEDEYIDVIPMRLDDALELIWRGELRDAKSALALIHAARREGKLQ